MFPDYDIQVAGEQSFEIFGYKIATPKIKAPYLGHAGVILINGDSGLTRYYEYGRYPNPNSDIPGNVRKVGVSDVVIKNGLITEGSLKHLLRGVSDRSGDSGRISGVVLRGDFFSEADDWLRNIRAQNNSADKVEYDVESHNCMTFTIDLADHLGLDTSWRPPVVVPSAYIEQFQLSQVDLDYDYETDTLEVAE